MRLKNRSNKRKFLRYYSSPSRYEKAIKKSEADRKRRAEKAVKFNQEKGLFLKGHIFILFLIGLISTFILLR